MMRLRLMPHRRSPRHAFTLVELAVVLVIIGLLVGGVLVGQTLIRQSQLRSIVKEKEEFQAAIYAFQNKYNGLPGDLANAYNFFGSSCGTDTTTIVTGCNGNGNGEVDYYVEGENFKAWKHLAQAKMIGGKFDQSAQTSGATTGSGATLRQIGYSSNMPESRFPGNYWNLTDYTQMSPAGTLRNGGLYLEAGGITPPGSQAYPVTGATTLITNGEALVLDQKIDDGKSKYGLVRGMDSSGCGDKDNVLPVEYYYVPQRKNEAKHCLVGFILIK